MLQIANDENNVFPHLANKHKGSNDEIPSLNIFKLENSESVTLTLRSCAGVWVVLITTLYKYLSSYQISTECIRIRSNNLIGNWRSRV